MKENFEDEFLSEFYKSVRDKTDKYMYDFPEEKGQRTGTKKCKMSNKKRQQLRKKRKKR
jgi:hypothetical protein